MADVEHRFRLDVKSVLSVQREKIFGVWYLLVLGAGARGIRKSRGARHFDSTKPAPDEQIAVEMEDCL